MTQISSFILLAVCLLLIGVTASRVKDDRIYELFIFPQGCLEKFLAFDLLNFECIKPTLSKLLGYVGGYVLEWAARKVADFICADYVTVGHHLW